jgi:hypothetical protein
MILDIEINNKIKFRLNDFKVSLSNQLNFYTICLKNKRFSRKIFLHHVLQRKDIIEKKKPKSIAFIQSYFRKTGDQNEIRFLFLFSRRCATLRRMDLCKKICCGSYSEFKC